MWFQKLLVDNYLLWPDKDYNLSDRYLGEVTVLCFELSSSVIGEISF